VGDDLFGVGRHDGNDATGKRRHPLTADKELIGMSDLELGTRVIAHLEIS
jgi:hypothetical protein